MKIKIIATAFLGLLFVPTAIYAQTPTEEACVVPAVPNYEDNPSCVYPFLAPNPVSSCYFRHIEIKQRWEANCKFYFNTKEKQEREKQEREKQEKEETKKIEELQQRVEELKQNVEQTKQKYENRQKTTPTLPSGIDLEKIAHMLFPIIPPAPTITPAPKADVLSAETTQKLNVFERAIQAIKLFFGINN